VETFIPARKKLKHKDAERPQIRGEIVAFVEDYLRSNVLWSPAERPRLATFPDLLGKPEIHLYPATHRRHCYTYRESVKLLLQLSLRNRQSHGSCRTGEKPGAVQRVGAGEAAVPRVKFCPSLCPHEVYDKA